MKKIIIFLAMVFAYSDVYTIITQIKKMESFKPEFKKIQKYNIFSSFDINNNSVKSVTSFAAKADNLIINAIFQNRVNINGTWYKLGDMIEGYRIVKVYNNEVILKRDNKIKKLVLKSNILKVLK